MVKIVSGKRIRNSLRKTKIKKPSIKRPTIKKPSLRAKEPDRTAKAISKMKIRGAREIAKAAVKALGKFAKNSKAKHKREFIEELEHAKKILVAASPTTPMLRNCLSFIINEAKKYEGDNITRYVHLLTGNYFNELEMDMGKLVRIGADQIKTGDVIVTNYHSDAVLEILKKVKGRGKKFKVVIIETGPHNQGLKIAKKLLKAGVDVTFCANSAIGIVMEKATKVIVGSHAILSDGSLVNKAGTMPLAMVAKKFNIPFYVVAETLKYDASTSLGRLETIEESDPDEIIKPRKLKGATILNPAYDITPEEYIHTLITEKGIMKPDVLRANIKLES